MPNKRGKLRPSRDQKTPVLYRDIVVRADGVDEQTSSLPIILATESPVEVFDLERLEIINEVLLMDGVEFPSKIPLLDTHDRSSVRNVLGSIRELTVEAGSLVGRAHFSSRPEAQYTFFDLVHEHIADFSVGARRIESIYVRDGETQTIAGKLFRGPLRVVTRSAVFEGSVVVVGADPNAHVSSRSAIYRAYSDPQKLKEEFVMDALRNMLIERGMDDSLKDAEVMDYLSDLLTRDKTSGSDAAPAPELDEIVAILRKMAEPLEDNTDRAEPKEIINRERDRINEINELCAAHSVDDSERKEWIDAGKTAADVAREVLRQKTECGIPIGPGADITITRDSKDKFFAAAATALTCQAVQGAGLNPQKALERAKTQNDWESIERSQALVEMFAAPGAESRDLRHAGLFELARAYCGVAGLRITPGMPRQEIVRLANGHEGLMARASDGAAYHSTGSFSHLMLDAANKTLLAAYDEAPVTYPLWTRLGPPTSDFKQFHRVKFGELPDPEVVPENHPYPEKAPTDDREFASVQKHGEIFSISLEAQVNDDLNAISRIPAMQGNAMRRKINRSVYTVLTSNPTLRDTIALFHASSHGANLDATALAAGAPLDTGFSVMMTQQGLNSNTILNIVPRYLIVPAALSATALQIATQTVNNATVANGNLYGPGGPRPLTVVADGQLDGDSTTAWWLAAGQAQVDTVEVVFLQGEESPVLSREDGFTTDTLKYKIRQSFVAFAVDYRGLYQGNS